jgi:serine phosphatase RsbU (regulator of sigma subunit)
MKAIESPTSYIRPGICNYTNLRSKISSPRHSFKSIIPISIAGTACVSGAIFLFIMISVIIFDISGHGIASAFYALVFVGLVENHLKLDTSFDYPKLAADISDIFYSLAKGTMHVTAVCCIYVKATRSAVIHESR